MDLFPGKLLFKLKDTHGLPFDVTVEELALRGILVEWPSFIEAARSAGWWDFQTLTVLENIFQDTPTLNRWMPEYKAGLIEKFKLYVVVYRHPAMLD